MHPNKLARLLAWSSAALSVAFALAGVVVNLLARVQLPDRGWLGVHQLFSPATAVAYAVVGALVASRQPRNPIGWIFGVVGVFAGLTGLAFGYRELSEASVAPLPGIDLALWLDLWAWIPATLLPATFVLLLFPDGRFVSSRWRLVGWLAGLGTAAFVLGIALHPRPPIEPLPPRNPYGIPGAEGVLGALWRPAAVCMSLGIFGSLAALVVRFRRSRGTERQQLKWLVYGSVLAFAGLLGFNFLLLARPDDVLVYELAVGSSWVMLAIVVVTAGIAILRHRLYDIDLIINRTLVYGALSAGVVGLYVLLVGALGALFQTSGNLAIALLATAVAALVFQPLRARLQRGVNRLMYGQRDDPYAVLSGLSRQLETSPVPAAVLPTIAQAVAETLKLPYVALALQRGNGLEIAAAYGVPAGEPLRLPLVYQTETVGQMLIAPRAPGEAFTPAERRLLDDIALQAGIAAHAVQLTHDLQRSRERLVTAREEERRRLRRDLHDGLGPTLAGLSMQLEAAQALVVEHPDEGVALLGAIRHELQDTVGTVRRLVYALRPPVLDQLGLVAALREHARQLGGNGLLITIEAADERPVLPAAVEVATYYIAVEAMTNAARHAQAQRCTVGLASDGAWVELEVADDGRGVPVEHRAGVGVQSMRERAEEVGGAFSLEAGPGGGTRVRARLPIPNGE